VKNYEDIDKNNKLTIFVCEQCICHYNPSKYEQYIKNRNYPNVIEICNDIGSTEKEIIEDYHKRTNNVIHIVQQLCDHDDINMIKEIYEICKQYLNDKD
jgi:3-methyladenine DNA glycosylase AlkD